jgi:hypothetical protein
MARAFHIVSRSKKRLTLFGALVVLGTSTVVALAYVTSTGAGTGTASTGTLHAPKLIAVPGAGTVALSWTTVAPPTGLDPVTYFVTRAGGECPTAASPTGVTTCTDSGLAAGTYGYTVTAKWHSWTATSTIRTVTVDSGPLDHFVIRPSIGSRAAGSPFSVTVIAKDSSNKTVRKYSGTVHFTSNDPQAVLPGDYTFTTGARNDHGVHTFANALTLKTAGAGKTVTVQGGGATGTATARVVHADASQISLTGSTSDLASGTPRSFRATIQDAYGNTVDTGPDSTAVVSFGQTGGAGSVSFGAPGLTSGGVATDVVTGVLAGSVMIGASATLSGPGSRSSSTLSFTVVHGAAYQIALTGPMANLTSGSTRSFLATIQDAAGNTVKDGPDSTATITFGQTAAPGSVSFAAPSSTSGGVAVEVATGVRSGLVLIQATATLSGPGSTSSNAPTFTVVHGAALQILLTGGTGSLTSGTTHTLTATIEDAAGNTVDDGPDSTAAVSFGQTGGSGSVSFAAPGSTSGGVATDVVTGVLAGSVMIGASATLSGPGSTSSNTLAFDVVAGVPANNSTTITLAIGMNRVAGR